MFPIYEEQIQHVIDMQNRKAIKAERLRLARAGRPDPMLILATRIRASLATMIFTLHLRTRREQILPTTSLASPEESPVRHEQWFPPMQHRAHP